MINVEGDSRNCFTEDVITYNSDVECINNGSSFTLVLLTQLFNVTAAWSL